MPIVPATSKTGLDDTALKTYLKQIETQYATGVTGEHSHRPALITLLRTLQNGITPVNEPKRVACGSPDLVILKSDIPLGYVETKDLGIALDKEEKSDQMRRYLGSLGNLILTDYLEFRWYVAGEKRLSAKLATITKTGKAANNTSKLKLEPDGIERVSELLTAFITNQVATITNPKELAERMARTAQLTRDTITRALKEESDGGELHQQMEGFRTVLLPDLTIEQFADMYAQTICYGMFAARCNKFTKANNKDGVSTNTIGTSDTQPFTRRDAAYDLPKTNPFLRKTFSHIAGPDLDERITWIVDDLAELLNRADIGAILKDFGKRTQQQDPVVHFYETFLAAYDPKMREARGVYYTPEPVVSYIVRSVDAILKRDFGLSAGLADSTKLKAKSPDGKHTFETHQVQILDPATGTGTFLHGVVDHIYEQNFKNKKGMWSAYVSEHLLPRLSAFELLMAPYTVAHMKLGLQLAETGYDFQSNERLHIYLTNTLEEGYEGGKLPFVEWLVEEAMAASGIKYNAPVMVVLGNPPYSGHSSNKGKWIIDLLHGKDNQSSKPSGNYFAVDGKPLDEKNPKWLNDDYVKFIRFAQWRIERTGYGILAFVTNHGYLDNPTFRGMRQSLMQTFDDIYVLDLHGNSKKKERSPDGSIDENVFDIQQGVAISILVKKAVSNTVKNKLANVYYAELYGLRNEKYRRLLELDSLSVDWSRVNPQTPFYLFGVQNTDLLAEYEANWQTTKIFPVNSLGIVTARDDFSVRWTSAEIWQVVNSFIQLPVETARDKYNLGADVRDWKVELAQKDLRNSGPTQKRVQSLLYRPFDIRYTYYTGNSRGFHCMPRNEVMQHLLTGDNLAFSTPRSIEVGNVWQHIFCSRQLTQHHTVSLKEVNYLFPLYLYPDPNKKATLFDLDTEVGTGPEGRRPNLAPAFISDFQARLGLQWITDGKGDLTTTFGPEDIFSYMYAIFHAPSYRSRYAEFLKIDFPRLPLTSNVDLFGSLVRLGAELVTIHLMEKPLSDIATYNIPGNNQVDEVRYTEPITDTSNNSNNQQQSGRVWINKTQYFEGVSPEVWNFHIGGYQVCQKWLKDRKSRQLTFDDLSHYLQIVAILAKTIELMGKIDQTIESAGGWPIY